MVRTGPRRADERAVRIRRILLAAGCAAALAGSAAAAGAGDPYAGLLAPSGTCGAAADAVDQNASTARRAMLCLTNYARAHAGLSPLQLNAMLDQAGQAKLRAQVRCDEFSHTPCGISFMSMLAGYVHGASSYRLGENIAAGTGSPRQTMNAWLHSTGHRRNILDPDFRELGVGYLPDQTLFNERGLVLWSQELGVRTLRRR